MNRRHFLIVSLIAKQLVTSPYLLGNDGRFYKWGYLFGREIFVSHDRVVTSPSEIQRLIA